MQFQNKNHKMRFKELMVKDQTHPRDVERKIKKNKKKVDILIRI